MSRGLGVLQRRALEVLRAHSDGLQRSTLLGKLGADARDTSRALRTLVARGLVETWLAPKLAPVKRQWATDYAAREQSYAMAWPWDAQSPRRLDHFFGDDAHADRREVRCYRALAAK